MNRRLIGLGTGGVLWLSILGGCAAEQQDPQCVVARAVSDGSTGSFATTYEFKPGQDPASACAKLKSEPVGMQKYFNQDPNAPNSVAVRPGNLTNPTNAKLDASALNQPNSVGDLTTKAPGPDHFCEVPSLSTTRLVGRYMKDKLPADPFDVTYAWSNLRIYNTPDIPGTQFIADLRYTVNGCTAEFTARGIWPVVSCATSGKPDETKCLPYADPPTRLRGSGINPSFPVKCDPEALICVLTGEVPSVP